MNTFALFFDWYFVELPQKIYRIWLNFLWFFKNYFSLGELLKTFFAPWKGYYFVSGRGLDIGLFLGNFIFNTFSRLIGMVLRFFVILLGVIVEIFVGIFGILFFSCWLFFPFLLLLFLFKGLKII